MRLISVLLFVASVALTAADIAPTPTSSAPAVSEARTVLVTQKSTVLIRTSVFASTLIVLPEEEKIATVFEGDRSNWRYDTAKISTRYLSIKPIAPNIKTDLHVVSDHGNSYSFLLQEVSSEAGVAYDSKVFLEAGDQAIKDSLLKLPVFVPAEEADKYKQQAAQAREELQKGLDQQQQALDRQQSRLQADTETFRATYPAKLRFPYQWDAKAAQKLGVQQIWTDDKFTYIRADPQETPALYEIKDNQPSLVNYDYRNGLYTVPKLIEHGYLAVGKAKMDFWATSQPTK
jgi:type IV secretion system protein VirB9